MTSDGRVVRLPPLKPSGEGMEPKSTRLSGGEARLGPSAQIALIYLIVRFVSERDRPERPRDNDLHSESLSRGSLLFPVRRVSVTDAVGRPGRPKCPVQPAHVPSHGSSLPSRCSCSLHRCSRRWRRGRPTRPAIRARRRARNRPPSRPRLRLRLLRRNRQLTRLRPQPLSRPRHRLPRMRPAVPPPSRATRATTRPAAPSR